MCLAVPMKVIKIKEDRETGTVEDSGIKRDVGLMLLEDVKVNDWVLIHAGMAISKLDEYDASETLRLLKEAGIISNKEE